nr:Bm8854 [Brugia malayi]
MVLDFPRGFDKKVQKSPFHHFIAVSEVPSMLVELSCGTSSMVTARFLQYSDR